MEFIGYLSESIDAKQWRWKVGYWLTLKDRHLG